MGVDLQERPNGVVVVVMDWPGKRNALGPDDAREVGDALRRAGEQAGTGVVLTGNGAFSAGGDLAQFAELSAAVTVEELREQIYGNVHSVLRSIRACPVPVAAAVDGPALGLGLDYAVACDLCFVGVAGWFQQAWAIPGLIHGAGGSAFIQRAAGQQIWRLIAEQERIDGADAERLGIAEAVDGSALDAAAARLGKLGSMPRATLEAYTGLVRGERWPSDDFFDRCADHQARFIGSDTFRARAEEILSARARRTAP